MPISVLPGSKETSVSNPPLVPNIANLKKKRISWKNIIIGVVVGTILVAVVLGGWFWYQLDQINKAASNSSIQITTKTATPSSKVSTPSATTTETAGWKIYTNSKLGFSIKYPNTWSYNDATKFASDNCPAGPDISDSEVIFDGRDLKCVGIAHEGLGTAGFEVSVANTEFEPLEQLSTQVQKYTYLVINGERAAKTYKTATSEGPWCDCSRIYFNHVSRGYTIEFLNTDLQGNHDSTYDKILSTFKFL
jgi:hypothetical protein